MKWILLVAAVIAPHAVAVEMLTQVSSDAIQAEGMTAAEIAERGAACIKYTAGNKTNSVEPAIDGTTAYAAAETETRFGAVETTYRSRLAVVARDGRYKVEHTNIEWNMKENPGRWYPVKKSLGTGWKRAEAAMTERSAAVAACIANKPAGAAADETW
jgi:hypothetical protein